MKKVICILLMVLLTVSVCACAGAKEPNAEQTGSAENSAVSENGVSGVSSETAAADETSLLLAQLQNQLDSLRFQQVDYAFVFYNKTLMNQGKQSDMRILRTSENAYDDKMYLIYPDGSKELLYDGHHVLQPCPSPDGTKVLINSLVPLAGGSLWIYDVDTRIKKETAISASMEEEYAAAFMSWLDNRYFLFVEFFYGGSDTHGGDLWVYDTQTDHFFKLISCTQSDMEICEISVQSKTNGSFFQHNEEEASLVLFQVATFEEGHFFEQYRYAVIPAETLYDAIKEQKELVLTNDMLL